jgi:hypothetical protein
MEQLAFCLLSNPQTLFPKSTFNAISIILLGNSGFEAALCLQGYRPEFCVLLHVAPASAVMTVMQ